MVIVFAGLKSIVHCKNGWNNNTDWWLAVHSSLQKLYHHCISKVSTPTFSVGFPASTKHRRSINFAATKHSNTCHKEKRYTTSFKDYRFQKQTQNNQFFQKNWIWLNLYIYIYTVYTNDINHIYFKTKNVQLKTSPNGDKLLPLGRGHGLRHELGASHRTDLGQLGAQERLGKSLEQVSHIWKDILSLSLVSWT